MGLLIAGVLQKGVIYKVMLTGEDGQELERRDPYARQTDYESAWCTVDDASGMPKSEWQPLPFDEYLIYEVGVTDSLSPGVNTEDAMLREVVCDSSCVSWQLHVGSFTPEGTFAAAAEKLEHVAGLNFTAVQLMPICEHSDAWGYNPRQLMAVHGAYGAPDDLRALIRRAHELGLAVIIDVVCALCVQRACTVTTGHDRLITVCPALSCLHGPQWPLPLHGSARVHTWTLGSLASAFDHAPACWC